MTTFKVEFLGMNGTIKTGTYKSKRSIRQAQERVSLEYGAHVGIRIFDNGKEVSIWTI